MGTAWSFQDFKLAIEGGSGGQGSFLAARASGPAARVAPAAVPACNKRRLEIICSPRGHCPAIIVSVLKGKMLSWNPDSNAQAAESGTALGWTIPQAAHSLTWRTARCVANPT